MADLPTVSIVIPTLNEGAYIERCLKAVSELDYPKDRLTVTVVDSGSKDETVSKARKFGALIYQIEPKTISSSRNLGAEKSSSDIIAFLDADCVVSPDWLKKAVTHFQNANNVAVGSYPSVLANEANALQQLLAKVARGTTCRKTDWLPSANFIVRRSAFERVSGFDENLTTCEDADIGYRLKSVGEMIWDPSVTVYHLREPRTYTDLFKKEVWRSKDNLSGFFRHGVNLSELPSILVPAAFAISLLSIVVGVFGDFKFSVAGLMVIAFLVFAFSYRAYLRCGSFTATIPVYLVYFSARTFSLIKSVLSLISPNLLSRRA
jgi:glycosyltransferase involved in cell wall biosynthesis